MTRGQARPARPPPTPPGSLVYIAKVSKDAPGGLEALGEPSQAADAEGYSF